MTLSKKHPWSLINVLNALNAGAISQFIWNLHISHLMIPHWRNSPSWLFLARCYIWLIHIRWTWEGAEQRHDATTSLALFILYKGAELLKGYKFVLVVVFEITKGHTRIHTDTRTHTTWQKLANPGALPAPSSAPAGSLQFFRGCCVARSRCTMWSKALVGWSVARYVSEISWVTSVVGYVSEIFRVRREGGKKGGEGCQFCLKPRQSSSCQICVTTLTDKAPKGCQMCATHW